MKAVCQFIVLLLSTFPLFPPVFPLPLATLLTIVLYSSTLYSVIKIKKKYVRNGLLFTGNLDPSSLTSESPVVPLVCGFWRQENLLASYELFTNLCELNSCIWFWEEYNPFKQIYRVYRFYPLLSYFAKTFQEKWQRKVSRNFDIWNMCSVTSIYATCFTYSGLF